MGASPLETIAFLACLVAVPSTSAMASSCWQPQEVKAAEVRNLHTMLMIGALRCRGGDAGMTDRYNGFVTHNRNTLDTHNYVLKTRFMREYGIAGGQKAYDDFITGMANSHSGRLDDVKFCSTIDALTKLASEGSAADLEQLAANISEDTALTASLCKPEEVIAAEAGAEPAPNPIVQRTIVEVPGEGTVTVHTGATPPAVAQPDEVAAPAEAATMPAEAVIAPAKAVSAPAEVAAAPAAAAPAPVSQTDALRAAVAALQSATAALQMASQTNTPPAAPAAETKDVTVVKDAPVTPAEDPVTP